MSVRQLLQSISIGLVGVFCVAAQELNTIDARSLKGRIDSSRTSPLIVKISPNNTFYYEGKAVASADLSRLLDAEMDMRTPDVRRVFVVADPETRFSTIVDLLKIGRNLEVDDFSFATEEAGVPKLSVPVKLVLGEPESKRRKPGPRFLGVDVSASGGITFNRKVHTESSLVSSLKQIFADRKRRRIYIEGSRDVDKTVFVRLRLGATYSELTKILSIVNSTGAEPIALEIDWLNQ